MGHAAKPCSPNEAVVRALALFNAAKQSATRGRNVDDVLAEIAKQKRGIDTLETRNHGQPTGSDVGHGAAVARRAAACDACDCRHGEDKTGPVTVR